MTGQVSAVRATLFHETASTHAAKAAIALIQNEHMRKAWAAYSPSHMHDMPTTAIHQKLLPLIQNQSARWNSSDAAFVRNFFDILLKALGDPLEHPAEVRVFIANLAGLKNYLEDSYPELRTISDDDFSSEHKKILKALKHDLNAGSFYVHKWLWNFYKHTLLEIKEFAQESPKTFTIMSGLAASLLVFMNLRLGASTMYIDPNTIGFVPGDPNPDGSYTFTPSGLDFSQIDLSGSCHEHVRQISATLADALQTLHVPLPQHCGKLKTIAGDAQGALHTAYDFVKTPYDFLIRNPISSLGTSGDSTLQNSHFMTAFTQAANTTAEAVYAANTFENIVVHSAILVASYVMALKAGKMNKSELRQIKDNVVDFTHRFLHSKTATLAFGMAAGVAAHTLDHSIISGSALGMAAGYIADCLYQSRKRPAKALRLITDVKSVLKDFSQAAGTLADDANVMIADRSRKLKTVITAASISLSAYASLLFADVGGYLDKISHDGVRNLLISASETQGALTASAMVLGAFAPYNLIEDAAQHVIFGAAGGLMALGTLAAGKLAKRLAPASEINKHEL